MAKTPAAGERATKLLAKAETLIEKGHSEKALVALDAAIAVAPREPDVWHMKARLLAARGQEREALDVLDAALESIGADARLLQTKGQLHLSVGDFVDASEAFDRLIHLEPQNAEGWLGKGESLLWDGKADLALECAERAITLDAYSANAHMLRGDCLLKLKKWTEAFAAFTDAAKHDPQRFDSSQWVLRGDQFLGSELDYALQSYNSAIAQDARNPEGWHGKGTVLKARGDVEGALAAFVHASEVDDRFIPGYLDAGTLCTETGSFDRAFDFFERANKAQPDDPRPWRYIGDAREELGEHDKAQTAYEHAIALEPEHAETWNALGYCLFQQNRLDEAVRSYERAIAADSNYAWPHYLVSLAFLRQRRFDKAMEAIKRAIEIEPSNGDFWLRKLYILNVADKTTQAEIDTNAERTLEAIGSDSNQRLYLAHFLVDNGRLDRARDLMSGVEPSQFEDEYSRLAFAEYLLKVGKNIRAIDLIRSINPTRLPDYDQVTWSFLNLVADRLAGAPQLSEALLRNFLRELGRRVGQIDAMSLEWSLKGVRHLLGSSQLPVADKLVLATLIDVQEAKVRYKDLSFFAAIGTQVETPLVDTLANSAGLIPRC